MAPVPRAMCYSFIGCVALWGCSANASSGPAVSDLPEIERDIIASRRNITSARVVVEVYDGTRLNKRYALLFSGGRFRADYSFVRSGESGSIVFTPDCLIRARSGAGRVQFFGPETKPTSSIEVPDPRLLGFANWFIDTLNQCGFEQVFLRPSRDDFRIDEAMEESIRVWKVSFRFTHTRNPVRGEYWIAPDMGNQPVLVGAWAGGGEKRKDGQYIRCKLVRYNGDVWYPSEVIFRTTRDGEVQKKQTCKIVEAQFNQDVDEKMFTLAGLDLSEGRMINHDGELMWWTGHGLTPVMAGEDEYTRFDPEGRTQHSGRLRRWLLLLNSFVLALLACAILWGRWRRLR